MSDLLDEFRAETKTGGRPCWFAILDVTDDQRKKLDAAMHDGSISNSAISSVLGKWGNPVGSGSVRKHRIGECICG